MEPRVPAARTFLKATQIKYGGLLQTFSVFAVDAWHLCSKSISTGCIPQSLFANVSSIVLWSPQADIFQPKNSPRQYSKNLYHPTWKKEKSDEKRDPTRPCQWVGLNISFILQLLLCLWSNTVRIKDVFFRSTLVLQINYEVWKLTRKPMRKKEKISHILFFFRRNTD